MRLSPVKLYDLASAALTAIVLLSHSGALSAAAPEAGAAAAPVPGASAADSRASRAYQAAVREGPLAVQAFLADFPKGADLHFHLVFEKQASHSSIAQFWIYFGSWEQVVNVQCNQNMAGIDGES